MPLARSRLAALVLVAAVALPALPAVAAPESGDPVRLLVTYRASVDGGAEAAAFTTASVVGDVGDVSSVQVLEFDSDVDARDAAAELAGRADVVAVEPDRMVYRTGTVDEVLDVVVADDGGSVDAADPADPELFGPAPASSWGVDNDGGTIQGVTGRRGVDVGARAVWPLTTGRSVVVAVIDTGVDITHPLLRERIWTNTGETRNGRDDDGNGYVDDLHGWDFANNRPQVYRSADVDAHGTHVAGIIAGAAHEESGFVGVAPDTRIMPLKFIEGVQGRTSDAIAAIRYAQANGADVINASWGSPEPSDALRTVLAEVRIPVVFAAGNLGTEPGSPPAYPARYGLPNVISVAAIDNTGAMPDFSSRSREVVDVTAPGHRIVSTWPDRRLALLSGTSQAAPHVAGLVALALQRHPRQDPINLAAAVRDTVRPLHAGDPTRSGGLARVPALLDHLGTRVPACATLPTLPFTDVALDGVHHDAVACMLSLGVTSGTSATTYGSADGLSRAQIATMLANALDTTGELPPAPAEGRFADVAPTNVHRDNIERLARVGIVTGTTSTRYEPSRTVTRAEFAAAVTRAAEWLSGGDVRVVGALFSDTQGHADESMIIKASGLRIVSGRSAGVFDPDVPLRRDQAASMVTRLLDRLVQQGLLEPA